METAYIQASNFGKDELAVQYLPAVKAMAYRLKERLPSSVESADLVSIGAEELIKLSRRYDSTLNDSFWGYAKMRVYGSMLDHLRSLDIMSRSNRKLVKDVDKIISRYLNEYNKEPSDEFIAKVLNEDVKKIHEARNANEVYMILPLDDQLSLSSENDEAVDKVEKEELLGIIGNILEKLSKKEQLVIQLYYYEELNLREMSEILDLTESRISQIHKGVLKKIRDEVGDSNG